MAGEWSGRWESKIPLGSQYSCEIKALCARSSSARDFRVKNGVTRANASQCGHWRRIISYGELGERSIFNGAKATVASGVVTDGEFGVR